MLWKVASAVLIVTVLSSTSVRAEAAIVDLNFGRVSLANPAGAGFAGGSGQPTWDRGAVGESEPDPTLNPNDHPSLKEPSANEDAASAAPQAPSPSPNPGPKSHRHVVRGIIIIFAILAGISLIFAVLDK
jgi:hypothetical protein